MGLMFMVKKVFYDSFGRKVIVDCNCEPFDSGVYGSVYRDGDNVVKILKKPDHPLQRRTLSTIKHLDLKNFYKIYEIFSTNRFGFRNLAGYVSKYCESSTCDDLMTLPSEYFIESVRGLNESGKKLAENEIMIEDLFHKNVIIGDSGLVVIDVDLYTKCSGVRASDIEFHNNIALKELYFDLLWRAYSKYHASTSVEELANVRKILYELVDRRDVSNLTAVENNLSKCKRPIEYISRRLR